MFLSCNLLPCSSLLLFSSISVCPNLSIYHCLKQHVLSNLISLSFSCCEIFELVCHTVAFAEGAVHLYPLYPHKCYPRSWFAKWDTGTSDKQLPYHLRPQFLSCLENFWLPFCLSQKNISQGKAWRQRTRGLQNIELLKAKLHRAIERTCTNHLDD